MKESELVKIEESINNLNDLVNSKIDLVFGEQNLKEYLDYSEVVFSELSKNKLKTKYQYGLGLSSLYLLMRDVDKIDSDLNHFCGLVVSIFNFTASLLNELNTLNETNGDGVNIGNKKTKISYTLYLIFKWVNRRADKNRFLEVILNFLQELDKLESSEGSIGNVQDKLSNIKKQISELKDQKNGKCIACDTNLLCRYLDVFEIAHIDVHHRKRVTTRNRQTQSEEPKQTTYVEVTPLMYVCIGSEQDLLNTDEVDEDEISIWYDFNEDKDTNRLANIVADEKLQKHISRRSFAAATNSHYIDIELLKPIYKVLIERLQDQRNGSVDDVLEAAVAACFLLSIFTGLNAVSFINIEQLLSFKKLILNKAKTHYLWVLDAQVCQRIKGELEQKGNRYNDSTQWQFHVPKMWVDVIREAVTHEIFASYTNIDFNHYLNRWFEGYCFGNLSVISISLQFYFHISRICKNKPYKNFILGKQKSHEPPLSYTGFSKHELDVTIQEYILLWCSDWDDSVNDALCLVKSDADIRVGSQFAWKWDNAKSFLLALNQHVIKILDEPITIERKLIERKVNAYGVWMWFCCLLATGGRPVESVPGQMKHYDPIAKMLYVHDKQSKSRPVGRYVPLNDFVVQELEKYLNFLKKHKILDSYPADKSGYFIYCIPPYSSRQKPRSQPITYQFIKSYLAEEFPEIAELPRNWTRHFVRNHIALPEAVFKTWFAHDQVDELGFSNTSALKLWNYMEVIRTKTQEMFEKLNLVSVVAE